MLYNSLDSAEGLSERSPVHSSLSGITQSMQPFPANCKSLKGQQSLDVSWDATRTDAISDISVSSPHHNAKAVRCKQ